VVKPRASLPFDEFFHCTAIDVTRQATFALDGLEETANPAACQFHMLATSLACVLQQPGLPESFTARP
jgi:hypothetical protein